MYIQKKIFFVILLFSLTLLSACTTSVQATDFDLNKVNFTKEPLAIIELETGEFIKVSLFTEVAPNTVDNFISLSTSGFYDGLTFHRVIENFMIQGGDPLGTGIGGPGYAIEGEFNENGFSNGLKHVRGVISMARSKDMDSAGSQFFIMHGDASSLDGAYASFGYVIEGIETVDRIAKVSKDKNDKPLEPVVIKTIKIELNGYKPQQPKTID